MKKLITLSLAAVAAFAVGCSSNPHKAKDIETKMEKTSKVSGDENVGIKDGNLVVQKKVLLLEVQLANYLVWVYPCYR